MLYDHFEALRVSDLAAVDPVLKLYADVRSRRSSLQSTRRFVEDRDLSHLAKPDWKAALDSYLGGLGQIEVQLDNTSFIDHTEVAELRQMVRDLGSSSDMVRDVFGPRFAAPAAEAPEPWIREYLSDLKASSIRARVSDHRWRVIEEMVDRTGSGWFAVFNTLTVADEHYSTVFSQGSLAWRDYVRRVDRAVGCSLYGSVRKADAARSIDPYHSYFAVVERGTQSGRLHVHVLHLFRGIPGSWQRDPNLGLRVPYNRQIDSMKELWPFGHSMPIAVRLSDFDAFGRLGWRWPVHRPKGNVRFVPIEAKPAVAMARYIVKYVQKSYQSEKGGLQWRTRISRNFGLGRLVAMMATLSSGSLLLCATIPPAELDVSWSAMPTFRIRRTALRLLLRRMKNVERVNIGSSSKRRMLWSVLREVRARPRIVERLRCSIRGRPESNLRSSGPFAMASWKSMAGSEFLDAWHRTFDVTPERFHGFGGTCHARS